MAERIGQYLNRIGGQAASNFGDEASTVLGTAAALPRVYGGLIGEGARNFGANYMDAARGLDTFRRDVMGAEPNPLYPQAPAVDPAQLRIEKSIEDNRARLADPVKQAAVAARAQAAVMQPAGGPVVNPAGQLPPGYGVLNAEPPAMGAPVEPADSSPHIRYTDRSGRWQEWAPGQKTSGGLGGVDPAELAGLRARAMQGAPGVPDLNVPYTNPTGQTRSVYTPNSLWSLSQAGIAQDEAARSERSARYLGQGEEELARHAQEDARRKRDLEMEDPYGLDIKRKLAQIEMEKVYGATQAKAAIEAQATRADRDEYVFEMTQVQDRAEQLAEQIQASPLPPEEKAKRMEELQARAAALMRSLREARGVPAEARPY